MLHTAPLPWNLRGCPGSDPLPRQGLLAAPPMSSMTMTPGDQPDPHFRCIHESPPMSFTAALLHSPPPWSEISPRRDAASVGGIPLSDVHFQRAGVRASAGPSPWRPRDERLVGSGLPHPRAHQEGAKVR